MLYVPSFKHNLFSISQFCIQNDLGVLFTKCGCFLQDLTCNKKQNFGEAAAGLYVLKANTSLSSFFPVTSNESSSFQSSLFFPKSHVQSKYAESRVRSLCTNSEEVPLVCTDASINAQNISWENFSSQKLWHYRLGHLPNHSMKHIKEIPHSYTHDFPCDICPMARQNKLPFPHSQISSTHCFDLIHIDTWGPYRTQTYRGKKILPNHCG